MFSKNVIVTLVSKFIILLVNFGMVVFSTRVWGSEGRGEIALVIANISILTILTSVFCGSTIAYHSGRIQREFLFSVSLTGAIIVSVAGAIFMSLIFGSGSFLPVAIITFSLSLSTTISSWWLGKNKIIRYNLMSLLSFVSILVSLLVLYFVFGSTTLVTYYRAYYWGLGIALFIGIVVIYSSEPFIKPVFNLQGFKSLIRYGFNNEFNYFLQFLNYRLSYYFIVLLFGYRSLGIFSIVISISEAVWIVSQSLSAVHFSNVINSTDQLSNRKETNQFARQSFMVSILLLAIAVVTPATVYQLVFGNEFGSVSRYILYLAPGVVSIAVSNIYGHYFAGVGKLNILRNKSLLGLAASIILMPILVRKYDLTGACISLNVSYFASSLYLWIMFRKEMGIVQTASNPK